MNSYDPKDGTHDDLPKEHPIDRCKNAIAEHMDVMRLIHKEAEKKGASREDQFAVITQAVAEGLERGTIKPEAYIPAMVAYVLDL